ncbi:MAG: hypothetical protein J6P46_01105 [Bacteroidales bacterium]|nr:hypothetical protein [Bacteroidales bacterium]
MKMLLSLLLLLLSLLTGGGKSLTSHTVRIATGAGTMKARVLQPKKADAPVPGVLWIHGNIGGQPRPRLEHPPQPLGLGTLPRGPVRIGLREQIRLPRRPESKAARQRLLEEFERVLNAPALSSPASES